MLRELADRAASVVDVADQALDKAIGDVRAAVQPDIERTRESMGAAMDELVSQLPSLEDVLSQAARLPGTRIDRPAFLRQALGRRHAQQVEEAIESTPAQAGMTPEELWRLAGKALGREARRTTVLSAAVGVGGAATAAAIPTDLVQLYAHLMRAIQMLTYLYGWRDLCRMDQTSMRPEVQRAYVLFLGVMAGDERADAELARVASLRGTCDVGAALLRGEALDKVAGSLVARLAHRTTGQAVGRAVPIAGAVVAGTMRFGGFSDMWKRLRKQLAQQG